MSIPDDNDADTGRCATPSYPRCEQKGSSMLYEGTLGARKGNFHAVGVTLGALKRVALCSIKACSMRARGNFHAVGMMLGASKRVALCSIKARSVRARGISMLLGDPRCEQRESRCEQKSRPLRAKVSTMPPTLMGKKIRPSYLRPKVKRAFASSDGFCIGLSHDCL